MESGSDFEAWYRRERADLLRALWAMSGDRDLAAESVDEAFSRAMSRWDRVSAMDSPGGWVRTVAVNVLHRQRRRHSIEGRILRRDRPVTEPEPPTPDPELWAAIASLPSRQREVVVLRYFVGSSEAEVASTLGISEGAASASLVKARARLAEMLGGVRVDQEVSRS